MTKETMIWQTLSMIIAGMVRNKTVPKTKQEFEEKCVKETQLIYVNYIKNKIFIMDKEYGYIVINYDGIRYTSDTHELSETKEHIAKIMRGEDVSFSMKYQNKRHFFPAKVIRKAVITINYTDKTEKN